MENKWGDRFSYAVQPHPEGLAQAFILGREFIGGDSCALILGDNIFHGHDFIKQLQNARKKKIGATIFRLLRSRSRKVWRRRV